MPREPIVLSWSGGKDSSLTLAALRDDPGYEVVALLTRVTRGYERVSIHGVRRELVQAQASSVGLPLFDFEIEPQCSKEAYEAEFLDGLARVRAAHPGARRIAFGDLFLAEVRAYRERLLRSTGFEPLFPLWGRNTAELAQEFIAAGFRATLVCVDTQQLATSFAGREFCRQLLVDLPASVDPCGERGEFHTFVSAGPVYSAPITVRAGEVVMRDERFAFCDLQPAGDTASR
jgi:uncharacterized protein (TIGR00290 family)